MAAMPPKTNPFKLDLVILLNILTADTSRICPPTWCILSSVRLWSVRKRSTLCSGLLLAGRF